MDKYLREPINCLTHLIAAILSLIALVAMIFKVNMIIYYFYILPLAR